MFNWLDIVLFVILALTLILGIIKGLVRQLIGIASVIAGLVLAVFYHGPVGDFYRPLMVSDAIADLFGFMTIFGLVLLLGWLSARMFGKMMKGGIKFMDHVMGGAFGLVKGVLISAVIVFALVVFPVNVKALKGSWFSPYCVGMAKAIIEFIPDQLKEKFLEIYEQLKTGRGDNVESI